MTAVKGKLILAEITSTVHFKAGEPEIQDGKVVFEPHESRVIPAGETIDPAELTDYMLDLVKQGKAPGLSLLTEAQARRIKREAAIARGEIDLLQERQDLEEEAELLN